MIGLWIVLGVGICSALYQHDALAQVCNIRDVTMHRTLLFTALCLAMGVCDAAPAVSGVQGSFSHKSTITLSGTGFGTKATPSPIVWDTCEQAGLSSQWSGGWPNRSSDTNFNLKCRPPIRGIALPHNNVSMYMAGGHGEGGGADAGYNVMAYKARQISSYPAYTYASWYQRSDNAWQFCGDNNYKVFDYSRGTSPYDLPNNWYLEYNARPTSTTSAADWHILDDALGQSAQSLQSPDANGRSWWWNSAVNPMAGSWTKIELAVKYSPQSDGFIRLWENGVLKINYSGSTDKYSGTSRAEAIGGYARCYSNPNNWRYFADMYLDYTLSRVVFANNADLAKATIIETQVPTSWSDRSISVAANVGRLAGSNVFAFVFDASGQRNATGVQIGTSADEPLPPSDVSVE
jgi:hypothetical protein